MSRGRSKGSIERALDDMVKRGVIRSYMIQSGMPGLRWTLEGYGTFSTRMYTTSQVEDWLCGAMAGMDAGRRRMESVVHATVSA